MLAFGGTAKFREGDYINPYDIEAPIGYDYEAYKSKRLLGIERQLYTVTENLDAVYNVFNRIADALENNEYVLLKNLSAIMALQRNSNDERKLEHGI